MILLSTLIVSAGYVIGAEWGWKIMDRWLARRVRRAKIID